MNREKKKNIMNIKKKQVVVQNTHIHTTRDDKKMVKNKGREK